MRCLSESYFVFLGLRGVDVNGKTAVIELILHSFFLILLSILLDSMVSLSSNCSVRKTEV